MDSLKVSARRLQFGAGIYEVGEDCYVKMFITDLGRCIPINHRAISEEDLLQAYQWGRKEERLSPSPDSLYSDDSE
jgi:hypothetical protein